MSGSGVENRSRLDGVELEIFKLVRKHATSEQWSEWLCAPLEHAAADGNIDLFARLMDAGADGSAGWRGCHGRTLLGAAAYGKSGSIVRCLLRNGAKADLDVKFGARRESALHVAARRGAKRASNALMLAGADPNVLNGDMESPLHLAAEAGCPEVVNDLLLRGALPNTKTRGGMRTALHFASSRGYTRCVSELLRGGADVDSRDRSGETPLRLAAEHNHLGAVEELLAAGANVGARGNFPGYSALETAASGGHVDVVKALVQHGSNVKASTSEGFTPLHHASDNGSPDNGDVIRVLLEAGADVNAKVADLEYAPLHCAAAARIPASGLIHPSSCSILALLEGGADVNLGDFYGGTPLHDACSSSNVGGVELLLRWGADETIVNHLCEKTTEESVGTRELDDGSDEEQRRADDQRIRQMLARAPADRSWRRRGWLVLARSRPNQAHVAQGSLVGRVVGLDAEGVFRLVMSFV